MYYFFYLKIVFEYGIRLWLKIMINKEIENMKTVARVILSKRKRQKFLKVKLEPFRI